MIQSSKDALIVAAALGAVFFIYFILPLLLASRYRRINKLPGEVADHDGIMGLSANSEHRRVQRLRKKVCGFALALLQVLCCIYFYYAGSPDAVVNFLFAINIELFFLFFSGIPASIMLLLVALKWYWLGYFFAYIFENLINKFNIKGQFN